MKSTEAGRNGRLARARGRCIARRRTRDLSPMRVFALQLLATVAAAMRPGVHAISRRGVLASLLVPTVAAADASSDSYKSSVDAASRAFQAADYVRSETLWREAAMARPEASLAWSNLAITLIINASGEMKLGEPPSGKAKERLTEALNALDAAQRIDGDTSPDPLTLNSKGNALGLLLRWEEAATAYAASAAAARRDFVSIPRSNEALALFQLGELSEAERRVRRLMRLDPNFRDATALLAALRLEQGDVGGAASAVSMLCSGVDGGEWCRRYSKVDVVLGRWTPRAVDAYKKLLNEPSVQLELRNAQSLSF